MRVQTLYRRRRPSSPRPRPGCAVVSRVLPAFLALLLCAAPAYCDWLFHPVGGDGATDFSALDLDEAQWFAVELPDRDWDRRQSGDSVYGWYRYHFTADAAFTGRDMVLKLGIVDDADATYCNGVQIGQTGAFPPQASSA